MYSENMHLLIPFHGAFLLYWIELCSVIRPRQHSIGYMGDCVYRSKDPTNNIKVLKEKAVKENNPKTQRKHNLHICTHTQNSIQIQQTQINTASPLVYNYYMWWLGDGSHRGRVARPERRWGCRRGTPHSFCSLMRQMYFNDAPAAIVPLLHVPIIL